MMFSFSIRQRIARRGVSIIELSVVIVVLSMLVSMAAVMFSSLLKSQRQFTLRERQRREFVRLDVMFRNDVHAATKSVVDSPDTCELSSNIGDRWQYTLQDQWLVRTHSRGDQRLQRESFFVRPGSSVKFALAPADSRQMVELRIQADASAGGTEARRSRYLAQVLLGGGAVSRPEAQP